MPRLLTGVRNNANILRSCHAQDCGCLLPGGREDRSRALIMPKTKRRPTTDAVEILHRRYYEGKPERLTGLETERANDHVARKIVALRTQAGLSQRQLAQLVGTTASVICRLEDADYEGHSLAMLNRIAAALNRRVEIRFVPAERRLQSP